MEKNKLRVQKVVIIGNGLRAHRLYMPLIKKLPFFKLWGICGADHTKTTKISAALKIKPYKNIDEVLLDDEVEAIISCTDWRKNSIIYQKIAISDKPSLLETPLGHDFDSIKKSYNCLKNKKSYLDISEQYHMRPMEILKRRLIEAGLFGKIIHTFCIGVGHEYHGASLLRSYLGFGDKACKIFAMQKDMPYFRHVTHRGMFFSGERIQNAIIEFDSGAMGIFHWSWLNYSSAIRGERSAGFYGTKGSAMGENCLVFINNVDPPRLIEFKRYTRVIEGIEVLQEIVAVLDGRILGRWVNPLSNIILNEDEIAACYFLLNLYKSKDNSGVKPIYSVEQAYADHLLVRKIEEAS